MRNDEKNCALDYAPYMTPVLPYLIGFLLWVGFVIWAGLEYHIIK
jgi:hypothetical protein